MRSFVPNIYIFSSIVYIIKLLIQAFIVRLTFYRLSFLATENGSRTHFSALTHQLRTTILHTGGKISAISILLTCRKSFHRHSKTPECFDIGNIYLFILALFWNFGKSSVFWFLIYDILSRKLSVMLFENEEVPFLSNFPSSPNILLLMWPVLLCAFPHTVQSGGLLDGVFPGALLCDLSLVYVRPTTPVFSWVFKSDLFFYKVRDSSECNNCDRFSREVDIHKLQTSHFTSFLLQNEGLNYQPK